MSHRLALLATIAVGAALAPPAFASSSPSAPILPVGCSTTGGIAFDGANVYWTTESAVIKHGAGDPNVLFAAPLAGGVPQKLMTLRGPASLAVDATDVFVAQQYDPSPDHGPHWSSWIAKVPKNGGAPTVLLSGRVNPSSLHVDSSRLYWSEGGKGVFASKKDGSAVTSLDAKGGRFVADDTTLYVAHWTGAPSCGECATGAVERGGRIMTVAKDGKGTQVLADGLLEIQALALDDKNIYAATWSPWDKTSGQIVRIEKKTGKKEILARQQGYPKAIAATADRVVFSSPNGIFSVEKTSASLPVLRSSATHVRQLAAPSSGAMLYWTGAVESAAWTAQGCNAKLRAAIPLGLNLSDTGTIWGSSMP